MSQINLLELCWSKTNYMHSFKALEELADSKEGPLRIEYKNEVPHLGIRTWKRYFFEKLWLDDLDIPEIERKTEQTINSYVGTLVQKIENPPKPKPVSGAVPPPKTPDLGLFAKRVLYKLKAKALGKDLDPRVTMEGWMAASTTQPGYRPEKVDSGIVRSHNGKVMVPKGLSMGVVPIENVIADARLLGFRFMPIEDNNGQSRYLSMPDRLKTLEPSSFDENDYYQFYKYNLNQVGDGETSVAMQLTINSSAGSSEANRHGAWRAADEFIKKRATQCPVSVLLCTKNLPEVEKKPNPFWSFSQSQGPNGTNSDTESDSDYIG